jgi:drug/metabolite transporter (DMT)-like permease
MKQLNIFQRHPYSVLAFSVVMGATSGIITRFIHADPMAIGFYRLAFALPFFLIPSLIFHRREFLEISRRDFMWSIISGGFLFIHFYAWFKSITLTTIASAVVLMELHPVIVLFITLVFFRKKVPASSIMGIGVALLGGMIVAGGDYSLEGTHFVGDIYALASAVGMGAYFAIGNVVRVRMSSAPYVTLVFGSCWLFFAVGMLLLEVPFVGYAPSDYGYILLMTLVCQVGGHALFNWCLGYVTALDVSTWELGEIAVATMLAFLLLHEVPTPTQWVGALVVILGLLYYNRTQRKEAFHEL